MGCNCGNKTRTYTFQTLKQKDGTILPTLKYIHCAYNDQFVSKFLAIGIDVKDEAKLKTLASLSDTGGDVRGDVKVNGKPIKFSVEEILKTIDVNQPTNNNCSI